MSTLINGRIQQAYNTDLESKLGTVDKKATAAMQSFAELVSEINKLQSVSKGTTSAKDVAGIAADLNNSQVMVTRMLEAQLSALHNIVKPETSEAMPF